MENDAATAGVRAGGLFSTTDIRILICYILNTINEPVPVNMLANVLHFEGIANGFEVSDAVMSLAESGQIKQCSSKDDTYVITPSGRDVAETLKTSISFTAKDRAYAATLRMLSRFKNAKNTEFTTTHEDGNTYLTCSLIDSGKPFMSLKLLITDDGQVECIRERILSDPAALYSGIIDMLTGGKCEE